MIHLSRRGLYHSPERLQTCQSWENAIVKNETQEFSADPAINNKIKGIDHHTASEMRRVYDRPDLMQNLKSEVRWKEILELLQCVEV